MSSDYASYVGQRVGIYTTGRIPNGSSFEQAGSLYLEGLLESESDRLLSLKDLHVRTFWNKDKSDVFSDGGVVPKDKIVTLYRIKEKDSLI